jgi:hypothetical protein
MTWRWVLLWRNAVPEPNTLYASQFRLPASLMRRVTLIQFMGGFDPIK